MQIMYFDVYSFLGFDLFVLGTFGIYLIRYTECLGYSVDLIGKCSTSPGPFLFNVPNALYDGVGLRFSSYRSY